MKRHRGSARHPFGPERASREADDAGTVAARGRVAAVLDRLARADLQVAVVGPPDAERMAARDRARTAAITSGRGALFDEATTVVRERTLRVFARSGFSGTWALTDMSMSIARPDDRVASAAAFEEAAMAAVVEDLVDEETLDTLRSTSDELSGLASVPAPGSISGFGSPGSTVRGPIQMVVFGAFGVFLTVVGIASASVIVVVLGLVILAGLLRNRRPNGTT